MPDSEKDTAAAEVAERRATLDLALSNQRKYPAQEFRAFVQTARRYIAMTKNDPMIHKSVARAVNGLREYLAVERKRIPGDVLLEADRLECLLFAGYDPSFEGDEPPGCLRLSTSSIPRGGDRSPVESRAWRSRAFHADWQRPPSAEGACLAPQ